MNKKIFTTLVMMVIVFSPSFGQSAPTEQGKPVPRSFLCADYGGSMIRIISRDGTSLWEYPAKKPLDAWRLPNGNIVFTHAGGVQEVTPDKQVVWEYKVQEPNEVHSCQPLGDGVTLVAVSGPCEILEINRKGQILKRVKLVTKSKNTHGQMRQVRKTLQGTYLVGHLAEGVAREYDGDGNVIHTFDVGGGAYGALRLPNGNTLIACGAGSKLVEVDKNDKVVWQIEKDELEGNQLLFIAGVQRLDNGNTVVCNWGGHGHVGECPQIFEVTPDKKVVWKIFDFDKYSTIAGVQMLDVEGDVTKGQIYR